jgi:hypothetical protein
MYKLTAFLWAFFIIVYCCICLPVLQTTAKNVKSNIEFFIGNNQSSRVTKIRNSLLRSLLLLLMIMSIHAVNWNKMSPPVERICLVFAWSDISMRYTENIFFENLQSCPISFRLVELCQFYCVYETPVDNLESAGPFARKLDTQFYE